MCLWDVGTLQNGKVRTHIMCLRNFTFKYGTSHPILLLVLLHASGRLLPVTRPHQRQAKLLIHRGREGKPRGAHVQWYGLVQYANLVGVAVNYAITTVINMAAIKRPYCFYMNGQNVKCDEPLNIYMLISVVIEIVPPNIHKIWWLSIVAAAMTFSYSLIGLGLSIAKVAENGKNMATTSLIGLLIGQELSRSEKIWRMLQYIGNVACAFSFSLVLIEIQDDVLEYYDQTVPSPQGSFYIPVVLRVPHLLHVVKRMGIKQSLSCKNIIYMDSYTYHLALSGGQEGANDGDGNSRTDDGGQEGANDGDVMDMQVMY